MARQTQQQGEPAKRTVAISFEVHERLATIAKNKGFLVGRLAEILLTEAMDARRSGQQEPVRA